MIIEGIEVENQPVSMTGIKPGEMYLAKRNVGWKLLEANKVFENTVIPTTIDYPYNTWECFKCIL